MYKIRPLKLDTHHLPIVMLCGIPKFYDINRQRNVISKVTGQLADKPTRGQSSRRPGSLLLNSLSQTGQLAEMFNLKFAVNNPYKCD